jgi:hypothetical protein
VVYELKKCWKDGTTHVALDPLVLMKRLCALVPAPRHRLVTYHGVQAGAAQDRDRVFGEGALGSVRRPVSWPGTWRLPMPA